MATKYLESLTPLRGLAAMWVMLFHIDVSLFYRDLGALVPRDATGILSHGYLWVDFFFVLSGFIMFHVYGEALSGPRPWTAATDYLWARLARIYPLHLFCLGLCVAIALTWPLFVPGVKDGSWETFMAWKAIPSNLLLTHAMNQHVYLSWDLVSWSIGAEWWTYVATVPVIVLLCRGPSWLSPIVGVLAFVLLGGLVYSLKGRNLDITFNYGFFRCLLEFMVGLSVWRAWRDGWLRWCGHDAVIVTVVAAVAAVFHFQLNDLLVVPLFALLILGAGYNTGRFCQVMQARPLVWLGQVSYSVYLVHGAVFIAAWFLLPWLKTTFGIAELAPGWKFVYAVAFIITVLGMSQLTYVFVERPARLFLLGFRRVRSHGGL